ncbi:MAG: hypothetical protein QY321_03435 [Patescibacteria group bacterium]|nr:MAG: hypothetical protein QY321_03435 [Patescibacteria group bacterium]
MIRFNQTVKFQNDFKKLRKKYQTLLEDFKRLQLALSVCAIPTDKHTAFLTENEECRIIKIRLACRALRKSSLRVIYAYFEEDQRIDFIELYFKGDKENEDKERIKEYLRNKEK